jgi:hypothetical protein
MTPVFVEDKSYPVVFALAGKPVPFTPETTSLV